jgi:branched-chain amino acid transport system permease protein
VLEPMSGRGSWRRQNAGHVTHNLRRATSDVLEGKRGVAWPMLIAAAALAAPWAINQFWIGQILLIATYSLIVSGLVLSFGYAGELQFAQIAMFAVGAYLSGILAVHGINDLLLLCLIAGAAASLLGLGLSAIALRLGGWALGMSSFFLVLIVPDVVTVLSSWTGGYYGLSAIPLPRLLGIQLNGRGIYLFAIVILICWIAFNRNVLLSRYGGIFRTVRESPILAGTVGVSARRVKIVAYALGAFPAGVAGTIYAFTYQYVASSTFSLDASIAILAAVILGGSESLYGAVVGATLLQLGPFGLNSFQQYSVLVYGVFLVVVAIALRSGLSGIGTALCRKAARWIRPPLDVSSSGPALDVAAASSPLIPPGASSPLIVAAEHAEAEVDRSAPEAGPATVRTGRPLVVAGVSKAFGGVRALDNVDLTAPAGAITALVGANGSGKTTLLNVISGVIVPDAGSVRLGDVALPLGSPHRIARLGMARTFQTPSIPTGMTTWQVAASGRLCTSRVGLLPSGLRLPAARRAHAEDVESAGAALALVGLIDVAQAQAASLPLGSRRLLEVARGICSGASLFLLDEPASGLAPDELDRLAVVLRVLRERGIAVLVVEHNFRFLADIAQTVYVLHLGAVLAFGEPSAIAENDEVAASYLGYNRKRGPRT